MILQYARGTIQFGIHYSLGGTPLLVGLIDSNWDGNHGDYNSIAGYVFSIGFGPLRNNMLFHFLQ
jgi:hypothetical protein